MSVPLHRQLAAVPVAALIVAALASPMAGARPAYTGATSGTATPDAGGWLRLAAGAVDYAPTGLPDFDQRQAAWKVVGPQRAVWTHDGPVAAANALWWLDSQLEPDPRSPLEPADGFDLVQAHGPWDDHDPANVIPVVADLGRRAATNGPSRLLAIGTCLDELRDGVNELLSGSRMPMRFAARVVDRPTLQDLALATGTGEPAVLLLGIWQEHDRAGWRRVGGHYVALEAVDGAIGRARISDPFRDIVELAVPPTAHNDAGNVAHDEYTLTPSRRPIPILRLDGYLDDSAATTTLVTNFAGLNHRHCSEGDDLWLDDVRLEAQIEAALIIGPSRLPTRTAQPTGTPPVAATAAVTVTATVTVSATAALTVTATISATRSPSATPSATAPNTRTATGTSTATPRPTITPTPAPSRTTAPTDLPPASPSPVPTATAPPAGPGSICGRVVDAVGLMGLAGARVTALQGDRVVAESMSGPTGQYCLFDLQPAAYVVRASRARCGGATTNVALGGGLARVDLALTCPRTALLPMLLVQRGRTRGR